MGGVNPVKSRVWAPILITPRQGVTVGRVA